MKRSPRQKQGHHAEQVACHYLQQQGLTLVQQNYQCRLGEIDLIMRDQQNLVFVEVRLRKNSFYGDSAESVTPSKQRKISKTALFYLNQHSLTDKLACRFDVVALAYGKRELQVNWIQDAFEYTEWI